MLASMRGRVLLQGGKRSRNACASSASIGTSPSGVFQAPSLMIASACPWPVWLGHITMQRRGTSIRANTAPATCPEYMYPAWGAMQPRAATGAVAGLREVGLRFLTKLFGVFRDRIVPLRQDFAGSKLPWSLLAVADAGPTSWMLRLGLLLTQGAKNRGALFQGQGFGTSGRLHFGRGQSAFQLPRRRSFPFKLFHRVLRFCPKESLRNQ